MVTFQAIEHYNNGSEPTFKYCTDMIIFTKYSWKTIVYLYRSIYLLKIAVKRFYDNVDSTKW